MPSGRLAAGARNSGADRGLGTARRRGGSVSAADRGNFGRVETSLGGKGAAGMALASAVVLGGSAQPLPRKPGPKPEWRIAAAIVQHAMHESTRWRGTASGAVMGGRAATAIRSSQGLPAGTPTGISPEGLQGSPGLNAGPAAAWRNGRTPRGPGQRGAAVFQHTDRESAPSRRGFRVAIERRASEDVATPLRAAARRAKETAWPASRS